MDVKRFLLEQKVNNSKLFIAVEQGAGKSSNNVQIMLNPKVKNIARKWIFDDHQKIEFNYESEFKTSIDTNECQQKEEHNEDLRKFLAPVLQSKEAMKMKKCGSRMKTYDQAICLKCDETSEATKNGKQPKDKNKQGKDNNNNKKKNTIKICGNFMHQFFKVKKQ